MNRKFVPKTLDFNVSPYTGLTRQSWIEAGEYLLEGIFQHIKQFEDPVIMPRYETEVTYPNKNTPEWKKQAEIFEGLARSFFVAAPLIHIDPALTICGYSMRDYYKAQILRACTKGDPNYVLDFSFMQTTEALKDPFNTYQQTVETCALVICLWLCKEEIWDTYTKEEKDLIAGFIMDFAKGNTVPQNWRLFNMLDLAFLHMEGYEIDKSIMRDHAEVILSYYAGDGWYRDGHTFDYYSCWAFNVYAPIWNLWYGYENEPYLAQKFEEHSNKLMETYADFFDRDGYTNMWGRSNIYRNASTSAFDGNLLLKHHTADPGLARRISSGSLLQFLERDDLMYEGVPTLGFYGPFLPLVQSYSCAESPFWMAKAFLCLHLPKDHPFWTEKEHNGSWEILSQDQYAVKVTTLDGPALCFSNHSANGTTELRTGKITKRIGDEHGMWNYSKLSFSTKFPWESAPKMPEALQKEEDGICGTNQADISFSDQDKAEIQREDYGIVESQQYVLHDLSFDTVKKCNATMWHGEREGVLYRRQYFNYDSGAECHWMTALDLADFTVPYGLIRADKVRFYQRPVEMTLGSFGFPDNGTEIIKREKNGQQAMILKGHDHTGKERQLAMTIFGGWSELSYLKSTGSNPDSKNSIIIYAKMKREKQYGYEPYILLSQTITKDNLEDFADEELFPVKEVCYTDPEGCGGYGPVTLLMQDGTKKVIDYAKMEGKLLI